MKPNHILISGTYDAHEGKAIEGTDFQTCNRYNASHISVFLVDDHGQAEPVQDIPLGKDPAKAYADALTLAAQVSGERSNLPIRDTYQKRKGLRSPEYPRVERVRGHLHTCANVQPGSTAADVCDCGAVVDGKPVPVRGQPNIHVYKVGEDGEVRKQVEEQSPPPRLTVWYGPMPESNGKSNFTAVLRRADGKGIFDSLAQGITIARSEYPERVRYEADCMRFLIGEIAIEPFILDYDHEKHSGYVHPDRFEQMAESKGYSIKKNGHGGYTSLSTQHLRAGWDAARSTW